MRTLTEDEVTKEVLDIHTRPWPLGDVLFVKNLYAKDFQTGVIIRDKGQPLPTVQETPHIDANDPIHTFESLEAMVRAGWVVD